MTVLGSQQTSVRFCPRCASSSVNYSALEGGDGTCEGCHWTGPKDQLLNVPISHEFTGDEHLVHEMVQDLRKLVAGGLGTAFLGFLLRWGFIEGDVSNLKETVDRKLFSRYLASIAHGILTALLQERKKIEQEKSQQRMEGSNGDQSS